MVHHRTFLGPCAQLRPSSSAAVQNCQTSLSFWGSSTFPKLQSFQKSCPFLKKTSSLFQLGSAVIGLFLRSLRSPLAFLPPLGLAAEVLSPTLVTPFVGGAPGTWEDLRPPSQSAWRLSDLDLKEWALS